MNVKEQLKYTLDEKVCFTDGDVLVYQAAFAAQKTKWKLEVHGGTVHTWDKKKDANDYCNAMKIDLKRLVGTVTPDDNAACCYTLKKMLAGILKGSESTRQVIFLTGKGNFRETIYPDYKANRKQEKPYHYQTARDYLIRAHGAIVINGMEADDALAISQLHNIRKREENQVEHGVPTQDCCIATIDKDLDMVRGWHYNWNKGEKYFVSTQAGLHFFYKQLITGDATDNIKGIKGKGTKFAERMLEAPIPEMDMYNIVLEQYFLAWTKHFQAEAEVNSVPVPDAEWVMSHAKRDLVLNARLLWMKTSYKDLWQPPQRPEGELI